MKPTLIHLTLPLTLRIVSSSKECEYVEFQSLIQVPPTVWNILTSAVYSALFYDMASHLFCSISIHVIDVVVNAGSLLLLLFAKVHEVLKTKTGQGILLSWMTAVQLKHFTATGLILFPHFLGVLGLERSAYTACTSRLERSLVALYSTT